MTESSKRLPTLGYRHVLVALIWVLSVPAIAYWFFELMPPKRTNRLMHPDHGWLVVQVIDSVAADLTLFSPLLFAAAGWAVIKIWSTLSLWSKIALGLLLVVMAAWPLHLFLILSTGKFT